MNGKSVNRSNWGFTLIELVTVIAIIGLLITLALPEYFQGLRRSKETALKYDLTAMRSSLDKFYGDKGAYPQSLDELVSNRYLRSLPADPITERNDTWVIIAPPTGQPGAVYDVKSGAEGNTLDGIPYNQL